MNVGERVNVEDKIEAFGFICCCVFCLFIGFFIGNIN